jgi:hypothetical protein
MVLLGCFTDALMRVVFLFVSRCLNIVVCDYYTVVNNLSTEFKY